MKSALEAESFRTNLAEAAQFLRHVILQAHAKQFGRFNLHTIFRASRRAEHPE